MGWGTNFTADIYLSRERFENEYELDEKIKETKEWIQTIREKILMVCMGGKDSFNLKDCEDNECDAVDVVHRNVNEWLDWLIREEDKLFLYELLRENFDKKENT